MSRDTNATEDLVARLNAMIEGPEPMLSSDEVATLKAARDRLNDGADAADSPSSGVSVTLRPRLDLDHFAADLRTLADEVEQVAADHSGEGGAD